MRSHIFVAITCPDSQAGARTVDKYPFRWQFAQLIEEFLRSETTNEFHMNVTPEEGGQGFRRETIPVECCEDKANWEPRGLPAKDSVDVRRIRRKEGRCS